jgi:hypothetical protein
LIIPDRNTAGLSVCGGDFSLTNAGTSGQYDFLKVFDMTFAFSNRLLIDEVELMLYNQERPAIDALNAINCGSSS